LSDEHQPLNPGLNPDELEVVPGFEHEQLQGWVLQNASAAELAEGLEKAFDYRGDITLNLRDGKQVEGYLFDRQQGPDLARSYIRLMPSGSNEKLRISYSDVAGIAFTGRDSAAGKSWEAWVRKYWEKKLAGEKNIELTPESLD
jgi:hypothetical protein